MTPLYPVAAFALGLTAAIVATDVARLAVPGLRGREQTVVRSERPPDGDHYLANDRSGPVDHHVIYFGIDDEVMDRLRAADVIFVGNSRLLFAMRPDVLRPFFAAEGLRYYVMGFGFGEADRFPLAIIQKFDLRPRVVVVNADGFFGGGLSAWADAVHRDTPFDARKLQMESEVAHRVRALVHQVVPNWLRLFGLPGLGARTSFISYRSRFDGTWQVSPWGEGTQGFADGDLEGPALARGEVAAAQTFKQELDERGTELLLTRVPSPRPLLGAGPARFALLLGVPLVLGDVPALTTDDRSHLSEGSAFDWSRAFVAALAPVLRAALATPVNSR